MDGKDRSNALTIRKMKKPLMERKRRERINTCLEQLKSILIDNSNKENRRLKLEKADILELTVRKLKHQSKNSTAAKTAENEDKLCETNKYDLGFKKCLDAVDQFFAGNSGIPTPVKTTLLSHLHVSLEQQQRRHDSASQSCSPASSCTDSAHLRCSSASPSLSPAPPFDINQSENRGINRAANGPIRCVNIAPKPRPLVFSFADARIDGPIAERPDDSNYSVTKATSLGPLVFVVTPRRVAVNEENMDHTLLLPIENITSPPVTGSTPISPVTDEEKNNLNPISKNCNDTKFKKTILVHFDENYEPAVGGDAKTVWRPW